MHQVTHQKKRILGIVVSIYHMLGRHKSFSSKAYWESRYAGGGLSGAGSYGRLAEYKAEFLNSFVRKNDISSVIEFGCGDGAQLRLFDFEGYIGLDVSKTSISLCMQQYADDESKSFYLYDAEFAQDNHRLFTAELSLSLDVIYHLTEDTVFEQYMRALFKSAEKFVIIYASNANKAHASSPHVRHRKFTDWVDVNEPEWALIEHVPNKYPLKTNEIDESFADFYVYARESQLTVN